MAQYDDYSKDLDRFLQAWERLQKDMQQQDRLEELAARRGMTVADVQQILERLDQGFRLLHSPNRPTRAEIVDLALKKTDSN